MALRHRIKSSLSPQLLRVAKFLYDLTKVPHYWLPYVLGAGRAFPPRQLTLELTYRCNLKCEMCPQAIDLESDDSKLLKQLKTRREMATPEILNLVDDAGSLGVKVFTLTGGEAFLRKDIFTITERIKMREMECAILTNGMLITPAGAANLVSLGMDKITISVDGPQDLHNTIRKNSQSFQRLIESVRQIQEEKRRRNRQSPYLAFSLTISARNANRISELLDVAREYGVGVNFGYLYYITEKMEVATASLLKMDEVKGEDQNIPDFLKQVDVPALEAQIQEVHRKAHDYGLQVNFTPDLKGDEIRRRFYDDSFAFAEKCFYPWYAVRVNPYGDVYPCPIQTLMGNVCKTSLAEIWNGEKYVEFRQRLKQVGIFAKCTKCCALNHRLWNYLPSGWGAIDGRPPQARL